MFKKATQDNLDRKKYDTSDRTYMVRVLSTLLLTHVPRPSMKDCEVVAKFLVLKYAFLKEHVRLAMVAICFILHNIHVYSILGPNTYIHVVRILTGHLKGQHQMQLPLLRSVK